MSRDCFQLVRYKRKTENRISTQLSQGSAELHEGEEREPLLELSRWHFLPCPPCPSLPAAGPRLRPPHCLAHAFCFLWPLARCPVMASMAPGFPFVSLYAPFSFGSHSQLLNAAVSPKGRTCHPSTGHSQRALAPGLGLVGVAQSNPSLDHLSGGNRLKACCPFFRALLTSTSAGL